MTKREIIKFLERKQKEKENAVRKDYEAAREQFIEDTYSKLGLPDLAVKLQGLLAEADSLWNSWKEKNKDFEGLTFYPYYSSLVGQLASYTSADGATYTKIVSEGVRLRTKSMDKLRDEHNDQQCSVIRTFTAVIATVQQMKNAKLAAIYLKELGFDLSELENPEEQPQNALMVPIDTSYLFVKAA